MPAHGATTAQIQVAPLPPVNTKPDSWFLVASPNQYNQKPTQQRPNARPQGGRPHEGHTCQQQPPVHPQPKQPLHDVLKPSPYHRKPPRTGAEPQRQHRDSAADRRTHRQHPTSTTTTCNTGNPILHTRPPAHSQPARPTTNRTTTRRSGQPPSGQPALGSDRRSIRSSTPAARPAGRAALPGSLERPAEPARLATTTFLRGDGTRPTAGIGHAIRHPSPVTRHPMHGGHPSPERYLDGTARASSTNRASSLPLIARSPA